MSQSPPRNRNKDGKGRDRGGGGRGHGGNMSRDVQVSKSLSWLLRHGAEKEGLTLGPGGYVSVAEVLTSKRIRSLKVTFDEVRQCVADNDKKRYTMIHTSSATSVSASTSIPPVTTTAEAYTGSSANAPPASDTQPPTEGLQNNHEDDTDPAHWLIRANQGHSIKIESEGLLTPITAENMPSMVVHGTTHAAWPLILASGGLKKMGRNHVHFATGLPAGFSSTGSKADGAGDDGEEEKPLVISGMRNSSSVLIFVDLQKAMEAGVKFWVSDNGVVLSEGDEKGVVPVECFGKVESRKVGMLLEDGKAVKELPEGLVKEGGGRGGRGGGRGRGRGRGRH